MNAREAKGRQSAGRACPPRRVDLPGCPFQKGNYANLIQDWEEIKNSSLKNRTFSFFQTYKGINRILEISSYISDKHDFLPPNCSRLQAILGDKELEQSIEKNLNKIKFPTIEKNE